MYECNYCEDEKWIGNGRVPCPECNKECALCLNWDCDCSTLLTPIEFEKLVNEK